MMTTHKLRPVAGPLPELAPGNFGGSSVLLPRSLAGQRLRRIQKNSKEGLDSPSGCESGRNPCQRSNWHSRRER